MWPMPTGVQVMWALVEREMEVSDWRSMSAKPAPVGVASIWKSADGTVWAHPPRRHHKSSTGGK